LVGTTVGILVGALLLSCTSEADGDNDAASSLVNGLVGVNVAILVGILLLILESISEGDHDGAPLSSRTLPTWLRLTVGGGTWCT